LRRLERAARDVDDGVLMTVESVDESPVRDDVAAFDARVEDAKSDDVPVHATESDHVVA
jgi:hypothetical protein